MLPIIFYKIERLESSVKQSAGWSNKVEQPKHSTRNSELRPDRVYIANKAAKMIKRSKNVEAREQSAIEEKSNLLKNIESASELKIHFLKHKSTRILSLKYIALFYGSKEICSNIIFEVNQGNRIAFYGKNGCGKPIILKFINGNGKIKLTGNFEKAGNLKISYVSQDTSYLIGNLSDFVKSENIDEILFKTVLRKLDFSRNQLEKDIFDFSGGQKRKY